MSIDVKKYSLRLKEDFNFKYECKVTGCSDVFNFVKNFDEFMGLDREQFSVIALNTKGEVIGVNTVSVGDINSSIVHPREVFKFAILSNAAAIMLLHNHPSGNCNPSAEDISTTERLVKDGKLLGIPVVDHIIYSEETYYSFKREGLI